MKSNSRLLIFVLALLLGISRVFNPSASTSTQVMQTSDSESQRQVSPQPPVTTSEPQVMGAPSMGAGSDSIALQRSPNGHFYADVIINGVTVHALVDTGASSIAFSRIDAARVGINPNPSDFSGTARTANGQTHFAPVTLNSVALGPFTRANISAAVMDSDMDQTLLGMTFLSKFNVKITGDTMILS